MARKNKRPAAGSTAVVAQGGSANSTPRHQKKRPDIEALWDACRKARNADASRKAQANTSGKQKALPDVVAGGDGLFPGTDQTRKIKENNQ
jgi:hypothetical protein